MIVGVAGIPALFVHVDPAPHAKRELWHTALNHNLARFWKKFLPALNGERVSTGQKLDPERMRRKCCMHLDRIGVEPASPLVTDARPERSSRLRKMPRAIPTPDVNARGQRLAVPGVHNLPLHEHLLAPGS